MKNNKLKKAVVLNGLAVLRLEELKKEYVAKNKRSVSYDVIISKALMNMRYEDLVS
jgi:hypothetical protein